MNRIDLKNIKLFVIVSSFFGGCLLLYTGYKKTQHAQRYDFENLSINVIDLSEKSSGVNALMIFGVILIALATFLILQSLLPTLQKTPKNEPVLTNQERKVVSYIKEGKTNKEIAIELSISTSTVKTHVNNVYKKLGINSRQELLNHH